MHCPRCVLPSSSCGRGRSCPTRRPTPADMWQHVASHDAAASETPRASFSQELQEAADAGWDGTFADAATEPNVRTTARPFALSPPTAEGRGWPAGMPLSASPFAGAEHAHGRGRRTRTERGRPAQTGQADVPAQGEVLPQAAPAVARAEFDEADFAEFDAAGAFMPVRPRSPPVPLLPYTQCSCCCVRWARCVAAHHHAAPLPPAPPPPPTLCDPSPQATRSILHG